MSFAGQTAIVCVAVACAGLYLARLAWQSMVRRRAACGHCAACRPGAGGSPQVVSLGEVTSAANGQAPRPR